MTSYRCCFLNRAGHRQDACIVESESDDAALVAALKLHEGRMDLRLIEVWDGERLVFPQSGDAVDVERVKRLLNAAGIAVLDDAPTRRPRRH